MSAPPRLAETLLRSIVGRDPDGEAILGDLHEEYGELAERRGRLVARAWYWIQIVSTGFAYARPGRASLDRVRQDLAFAIRGLRREPGFAAAVVITLGLAIGAGTAIFSVVDGVVLRPLPFTDPERLVQVWANDEEDGDLHVDLMYPDIDAFRTGVGSFAAVSGYSTAGSTLTDDAVENGEDVVVARTSVTFFETLGIRPEVGRTFRAEDAASGSRRVLLSHGLWERRFGTDPAALGRTVHLNGDPHEVVGIVPEGRAFPFDADVWRPLSAAETEDDDREARLLARLGAGVTPATTSAEVAAVAAGLAESLPETHANLSAWIQPLQTTVVRDVSVALYALLGAVGLVLLIACVNTANLLLARASRRSHEIAVRTALGAGRGRIVSLHLVESLVLAALGGVTGLLIGRWLLSFMLTVSPDLPRLDTVGLDARVILTMLAVTASCGVLFGVTPALHAASFPPRRALREGGLGSSGRSRRRLQSGLVTTEVALSTVLAFLALLLFSTFRTALTFDRGFDLENLISISIHPEHPPEQGDALREYFRELQTRVSRLGTVSAVGYSSHDILEPRGFRVPVAVEGRAVPVPTPQAWVNIVDDDFFGAAGIRIVTGSSFGEDGGTPDEADLVVNERFASLHLTAPGDGIGTRLSLDWVEGRVVGIARDVETAVASPTEPKVYVSMNRVTVSGARMLVRTTSEPAEVLPDIEREVREVVGAAALENVTVIEDAIRTSVTPQRFNMLLVVSFAVLALSLAAVGIYGVTAGAVSSRRAEIGIRRALGASSDRVVREVVRTVAGLTLVGIILGVVVALAVARLLSSLFAGVTPTDPVILGAVAAILTATAFAAVIVPVLRALRIAPTEALGAD